jgi:hypothetical protein
LRSLTNQQINMKAHLLSYVSLVVALIIFACQQQEEVKPSPETSSQQLVDEQAMVRTESTNARLVNVIGIVVPEVPPCTNDYTVSAKGTGSYCAPAGKPTAIKLATEYLDANNNVIAATTTWFYNQCVTSGVTYLQLNEHMSSTHDNARIRFYARFYYGGPTAAPYAWRFTGDEAYSSVAWLTYSGNCGN